MMVIRSRSTGTSSGARIRLGIQFVPVPVGFQALSTVPTGVYQTKKRLGGAGAAARAPVGRMASRNGRPIARPEPVRNNVRRLIGFTIELLVGAEVEERRGFRDVEDELADVARRFEVRACGRKRARVLVRGYASV